MLKQNQGLTKQAGNLFQKPIAVLRRHVDEPVTGARRRAFHRDTAQRQSDQRRSHDAENGVNAKHSVVLKESLELCDRELRKLRRENVEIGTALQKHDPNHSRIRLIRKKDSWTPHNEKIVWEYRTSKHSYIIVYSYLLPKAF